MSATTRPHILLVVARGEAVRNFIYSDTLKQISEDARVTLLTMIDHGEVLEHARPYVDRIVQLKEYPENQLVSGFRYMVHTAHYRWLWSANARHMWALHDSRARTLSQKIRRSILKFFSVLFANRLCLNILTRLNEWLTWVFRPTHDFDALFQELKPDLVFNSSHIHGSQVDLPLVVAHRMKIPTAAFIFSWDNLTTRSRIFVPYDYYLMWNEGMKSLLLDQYHHLRKDQVFITGTPQFDYHKKSEYLLSREKLCRRLGIDPAHPFILYTTGMDTDFLDEHKFIEAVIQNLQELPIHPTPQLVVRTYIKGTSPEIQALSRKGIPDVVFPEILWDRQWMMPLREDLAIYSSMLHHCALGINAASTVTLELMALNKPVINIGMEPPGSNLPAWERFSRHVDYEHYRPVAASRGVMVARTMQDLKNMIQRGLTQPHADAPAQTAFIHSMFDDKLDGKSGIRVANVLVELARR